MGRYVPILRHQSARIEPCGNSSNAFPQITDNVINVKVEPGKGEDKMSLDNIAKRVAAYNPKEQVTYKMIKGTRIKIWL